MIFIRDKMFFNSSEYSTDIYFIRFRNLLYVIVVYFVGNLSICKLFLFVFGNYMFKQFYVDNFVEYVYFNFRDLFN